jgi:hypothetical protein
VTAPLDIHRAAQVLIRQYGPDEARLLAARRCDALLELGDGEGLMVWKGVRRAVEELVRVERKVGERVN